MRKNENGTKKIISHEAIYKIMQWLPIVVSGVFLLKNIVGGNADSAIAIGIILAVFISILLFVKVRQVSMYVREMILSIVIPIFVFFISLNSGASYSDDFPLFLAVIGLTGLYLEPQFTKIQIVLIDALLVAMYLIHPEKAESLSQYILCIVVFTLAASLTLLVIKRGRGFIEQSEIRAKESEKLLESIRTMGSELQRDFANSSAKIEVSTQGLQDGSITITRGAGEVSDSCDIVHGKIRETGEQIGKLNNEVKQFESALAENSSNVETMREQVNSVSSIIGESGTLFRTMEEQMGEIVGIAKQINDISFKLTILSLNASVEAARANGGHSGFEVIASEMRELSENSSIFSNQVAEVVKALQERVEMTSQRFSGSEDALRQSEKTMSELVDSIGRLNQQFESLYLNIECQNANVNQIDCIFNNLNQSVSDMYHSSMSNQKSVEEIITAMAVYKGNVDKIVENTQSI